jgi:cell wall-associated NlpC family hydrolase
MKTNPRLKSFLLSSIVLFVVFGLTLCTSPNAFATQDGSLSRSAVNTAEIRETIAAAKAEQKIEYSQVYDQVVQQEEQRISDPNSTQSKFVDYALSLTGTPYWYGGSTTSGFDCSGFVGYVIKHVLHKTVRHSATSQMQLGPRVKDPLPGDLVGFGYGNYFGHIGIYIGNGKVVDALNPYRDTGVHDLDWMEQYVGPAVFVRIIEPNRNFNPAKITRETLKFRESISDINFNS